MNKFNKSKIALLMALASVFTVNNKSSASLVGDIADITATTTSSVSTGLAMSSKSKARIPVAIIGGIVLPISVVVGGYFLERKLERDKLADSIISSLRNKDELKNIRELIQSCKNGVDESLKQVKIAFNEKDKEIEIVKGNSNTINKESRQHCGNLIVEFPKINNVIENKNEKKAKEFHDKIKNIPGVEFNQQLELDESITFSISVTIPFLTVTYGLAFDTLNNDLSLSKHCLTSNVPLNISVCKNEQGELSSVCSINFDITDRYSYDNKHNISFRMSNKFELLIDGHSYDIDEMVKK
jgi:hypothetical protein